MFVKVFAILLFSARVRFRESRVSLAGLVPKVVLRLPRLQGDRTVIFGNRPASDIRPYRQPDVQTSATPRKRPPL